MKHVQRRWRCSYDPGFADANVIYPYLVAFDGALCVFSISGRRLIKLTTTSGPVLHGVLNGI
ncbi:hypothetical protein M8C21_012356 [Ambrosia artemisiifolia]|uniref:Uncharacterized protein n=1 Tax=Ambrosia artemisiifolia TaxID=4212 RepID=A0AAD5CJQ3_AMBAR|nr:hypothetical protein M8C21_012356 [Ambrosia artemisiifolia]